MPRLPKSECECGTKLTPENTVIVHGVLKICRGCKEKEAVVKELLPQDDTVTRPGASDSKHSRWRRDQLYGAPVMTPLRVHCEMPPMAFA